MALVKCHECGREISTEAKVCPNCGAKNKDFKRSKIIIYGGGFLVLFFIFIIYLQYDYKLNPSIPACESLRGKKLFISMIQKTPWARENMIKVIDVLEQKDISLKQGPENRICEVKVRLSNSERKSYIFTFENKKSGGYIVKVRPKNG